MDCEIRENEIGVVFSEIDSYKEDSENVTDINVKCNFNLKDTIRDWGICISSNFLWIFSFPRTFIYLVDVPVCDLNEIQPSVLRYECDDLLKKEK